MLELYVRLYCIFTSLSQGKWISPRLLDGNKNFFGIAGIVLVGSFLFLPSLPWMFVEIVGLVLIGLLLCVTIILLPVGLVIF